MRSPLARRPIDFVATGPRPRGDAGEPDLAPGPEEDLSFLTGDWRLFQRKDGHRYSLDDLATAWYAVTAAERAELDVLRTLDLGCGIGSVLQMVAWAFPNTVSVGVEAQAVSVGLARRSVRYNGGEDRVTVREGDLRDASTVPEGAVFDLVTGTPPYLPLGDGIVSDRVQCGPCRFETRGGVADYVHAMARTLAVNGRAALCQATRDLDRVGAAVQEAGLTVLRRRDVHGRAGRPALFTLFELCRSPGNTAVEPPLIVRDGNGRRTADMIALRERMGMPG